VSALRTVELGGFIQDFLKFRDKVRTYRASAQKHLIRPAQATHPLASVFLRLPGRLEQRLLKSAPDVRSHATARHKDVWCAYKRAQSYQAAVFLIFEFYQGGDTDLGVAPEKRLDRLASNSF
jgi:hypothetical protein